MKVIAIILYLVILLLFYNTANTDEEYYKSLNRLKTFDTKDNLKIISVSIAFFTYLIFQSPEVALVCAITLPYLTISAMCDNLTKLVYTTPVYVFIVMAIVIEQITVQNVVILLMSIITLAMVVLGLMGAGDQGMIMIPGVIYYAKYGNGINAILFMLVTIIISEIILYMIALKNKKLDGWFKAKEPLAFGPAILLGTIFMLFVEELCIRLV